MIKEVLSILIGLCLLFGIACESKQEAKTDDKTGLTSIKGELHFKLFSLGSYYEIPDSIIQKFESMIDSLKGLENISAQDLQLIEMVEVLKENDLINKPFFHLKVDSNQIVTVYLNEKEYEKVKKFDRQDLINENKKVNISLKGRIISDGLVECHEITSTEKVDGKTYWRK